MYSFADMLYRDAIGDRGRTPQLDSCSGDVLAPLVIDRTRSSSRRLSRGSRRSAYWARRCMLATLKAGFATAFDALCPEGLRRSGPSLTLPRSLLQRPGECLAADLDRHRAVTDSDDVAISASRLTRARHTATWSGWRKCPCANGRDDIRRCVGPAGVYKQVAGGHRSHYLLTFRGPSRRRQVLGASILLTTKPGT